ncbi:hypothetical protein PR048_004174 [Dryococelus australis]|uniref:Uncharacterized protein n=1 Tax=Dryococelus australis TaxID=614101 RepID=A0ABQ9I4T3_9NEOP|nr:hypothetical protein PR048_004174 [Dryococelus australis]
MSCVLFFQLIVLSALVAAANAGILGAPAVVAPGAPVAAAYGARPLGYAAPALGYAAPALAARPLAYAAPAYAKVAAAIDTDYDPNPSYSYSYDIQDALTGDSKGQQESRQGDVVQGSYSLTEPDGTRRTVEYTADPINGFNAVVHKTPLVASAVAKVAAPLGYAAPALGYAAPALGYAAPALGYAAPALGYKKAILGYSNSPRHCIPEPLQSRVSLRVMSGEDGHRRVPTVKPRHSDGLLVAQGGGGVAQRSGVTQRGGVAQRGGHLGDGGCGVSQRGGDLGDGGGNQGSLVHDGVEAVDGVGCVLDGATGAVRLGEAVAALDDVSLTALLLSLGVAGQSVLDVVGVAVGWVGVVVGVDGGSGDLSVGGGGVGQGASSQGWGGVSQSGGGVAQGGSGVTQRAGAVGGSHRGAGGHHGGGAQDAGVGGGHEGGQDDQLEEKNTRHKAQSRGYLESGES